MKKGEERCGLRKKRALSEEKRVNIEYTSSTDSTQTMQGRHDHTQTMQGRHDRTQAHNHKVRFFLHTY